MNARVLRPNSALPARVIRAQASRKLVFLREPALFYTIIVLACWVATPLTTAVYLLIAFHALKGPRQTLESFTVMILILMGNPSVFSGGGVFRWVVLFAGFGRVLWDWAFMRKSDIISADVGKWLLYFFLSNLAAAFTISYFPSISVLKVISFFIGAFTLLACFWSTRHLKSYWRSWFYTLAAFSVIAGVFAFFAGMGYARTENGFQGIWRHPQMAGPINAVLAAFFFGEYLQNKRNRSKVLILCVLGSLVYVFISGARTAAVSLALGLFLAGIIVLLRKRRKMLISRFLFNPLVGTFCIALVIGLVSFTTELKTAFVEFAQKGDVGATNASELFEESRGSRIQASLDNFKSSPFFGIGFGVPSSFELPTGRIQSTLGITTSASSEKGFMPSAILEESGLIGAILLFLLFVGLSAPIHKQGDLSVVWMYWSALFINVGAAILYSMGGLGFFVWFIVAYCYTQSVPDPRVSPSKHSNRPLRNHAAQSHRKRINRRRKRAGRRMSR